MKCPKCNQEPMSFTQFFLKVNPLSITCNKCGARLRAGRLLRGFFIGGAIYGFILGFSMPYLFFVYNWELIHVVLVFIVMVIVVGFPAEYSAWKYGRYKSI